jgi:hypothetical protein
LLPAAIRAPVRRTLQGTGLLAWPTKSYEVWLVLQLLLLATRPQRLIELGAGRSTDYLAEYALKHRADLVSIEEGRLFALKVNLALRLLKTKEGVVRRVAVRGSWYDHDRIAAIARERGPFDFLLIDGPSETTGTSRLPVERHLPALVDEAQLKTVIVDDTHRADDAALAARIAQGYGLAPMRMIYGPNRDKEITFLLRPGALQELRRELPRALAAEVGWAETPAEPALT